MKEASAARRLISRTAASRWTAPREALTAEARERQERDPELHVGIDPATLYSLSLQEEADRGPADSRWSWAPFVYLYVAAVVVFVFLLLYFLTKTTERPFHFGEVNTAPRVLTETSLLPITEERGHSRHALTSTAGRAMSREPTSPASRRRRKRSRTRVSTAATTAMPNSTVTNGSVTSPPMDEWESTDWLP